MSSQTKLTIYSRSGHIVQSISSQNDIIILPKSVNIESIIAIDSQGQIIPFSYVPEITFDKSLLDRSTGEKTEITVIKQDQAITGKIISFSDSHVVLLSDGQLITVNKYDQIIINIANELTRPHVILQTGFDKVTLSYLISNISWNCVGTILIAQDMLYLRLAANIMNNTETDMTANVTLVSGDIYQSKQNKSYEYAPQIGARAMLAAPMMSETVETSMLEDYVKYEVGDRTLHDINIVELGSESYPFIKLYIHETSSDNKVQFAYRFIASNFVPACDVNVYSVDANMSIDSYLGSSNIKESQKNSDIDIILGTSTLMQCMTLLVVSSDVVVTDEATINKYNLKIQPDRQLHMITEDITTKIFNGGSKTAHLLIKHYVGSKVLLDSQCKAYNERKHGFIEFYFEIEPDKKSEFNCQIITISYT